MDLDAIEAAEKAMTPGPLTQKLCRVSDRFDNTLAYTKHRADAEGIVILRNAAPEMIRRIREQDAELLRLRRFASDMGTTCYSCEVCGHARTTRECLWCEVAELRALCGEAADAIRTLEDTPHYIATEYENLRSHLRAASKGEQ